MATALNKQDKQAGEFAHTALSSIRTHKQCGIDFDNGSSKASCHMHPPWERSAELQGRGGKAAPSNDLAFFPEVPGGKHTQSDDEGDDE